MSERLVALIETRWHLMVVGKPSEYVAVDDITYEIGDKLISFQCSDLVRHLSRAENKMQVLPDIVDLECLDRQMSQTRNGNKPNRRWRILSALKAHEIINSDFVLKREDFRVFLERICELYEKLLKKSENEMNRFIAVESKINSIIYERQALGVGIDHAIAKTKCAELEKEIYKIKNELQMQHRIFDPDNERQQFEYLMSRGYPIIQSLLYSFKIRRKEDAICSLFYELIRNSQDLDSLLYMLSHWGSTKRTYPSYVGFGSITSRITLRQPALQSLRKSNRSVIVADEGMKLLYIDYSQFEAGILACLSDDDSLIEKYNLDIYTDLANKVLGDATRRNDAKIIFYRYIYGDETLGRKAIDYFNQFDKLKKFKQKINEQASKEGKVGTSEGNDRICFEKNCAWALSHVVQATASLIYKKAVIRANNEVKTADFLVPMHDGTLYQVNVWKFDDCKDAISAIYIDEFKTMFPKIKPKVNCSDSFTNP